MGKWEHCDEFADDRTCTTSLAAVADGRLVMVRLILAEEPDFALLLYCCSPLQVELGEEVEAENHYLHSDALQIPPQQQSWLDWPKQMELNLPSLASTQALVFQRT